MPVNTKTKEEIDREVADIYKYLSYKPSEEECKHYSEQHTRIYRGKHFYLFKVNRGVLRLTTHEFGSDIISRSNILDLIANALEQGTFVSLEKVTIREYAKAGGGDIPCCLRTCEYEGDWPPCMVDKK